jgi:hypothetical protein
VAPERIAALASLNSLHVFEIANLRAYAPLPALLWFDFAEMSSGTNRITPNVHPFIHSFMRAPTRRSFLASAAGLAGAVMAQRAGAVESQTPDQMLDELIRENQENGLGSGFDNASRNVRLPKKSLPTLSPSTAETTQTSIAQYEAIVAKGGWRPFRQPAGGWQCAEQLLQHKRQHSAGLR